MYKGCHFSSWSNLTNSLSLDLELELVPSVSVEVKVCTRRKRLRHKTLARVCCFYQQKTWGVCVALDLKRTRADWKNHKYIGPS